MPASELLKKINYKFGFLAKHKDSENIGSINITKIAAWNSLVVKNAPASLELFSNDPEGMHKLYALEKELQESFGLQKDVHYTIKDEKNEYSGVMSLWKKLGTTIHIKASGINKINSGLVRELMNETKSMPNLESEEKIDENVDDTLFSHIKTLNSKPSKMGPQIGRTLLNTEKKIDSHNKLKKINNEEKTFCPESVPVPVTQKNIVRYVNNSSARCYRWSSAGKALKDKKLLDAGIGLAYTQHARLKKINPLAENNFGNDLGFTANLTSTTLLTLNYNLAVEAAEYIIETYGSKKEKREANKINLATKKYKYEAQEIKGYGAITVLADKILDRLGREQRFNTDINKTYGKKHLIGLKESEILSSMKALESVNIVIKPKIDAPTYTSPNYNNSRS